MQNATGWFLDPATAFFSATYESYESTVRAEPYSEHNMPSHVMSSCVHLNQLYVPLVVPTVGTLTLVVRTRRCSSLARLTACLVEPWQSAASELRARER